MTLLLDSLTDEQRAFADSESSDLCCLAAAGSGKTAAVAARVVRLARRGVAPWKIRVFVFTRGARDAIHSRLSLVLGAAVAAQVDVTTFHAFACRVLGCAAASEEVSEAYLRGLYQGATRLRGIPGIETVRRNLVAHEAGDESVDPKVWPTIARLLYRMGETLAVPMWDALPRAEERLADPDELDRHTVDHVIVDEAQDVTPREARVAHLLGFNLAAVGDPRQAIMGFRGAVGLWPQGEVLTLTRSFRFGANIAAFSSALCRPRDVGPTHGSVDIEDVVRVGATHDDAVLGLRGAEASAAVLCRTHDECELAARQLSNLGVRVRYAGRAEPGDDRPDQFAQAAAEGRAAVATIHAAKGREWDIVYVPSSEIEPRPSGDDAECAYVAATRARKVLLWGDVKWAR